MNSNFYLFSILSFIISFNSVLSTTTTIKTTTSTIDTLLIQSVTIVNKSQINLKWTPNRVTTTNTRYKIKVIYKSNIIPSFEYPGN